MKKSVWIFLLAVFLPGAVLGWLALRGVEEQQIVFERRTAELYQKETDALASSVRDAVEGERRAFGEAVHRLLARNNDAAALARDFTNTLADVWPRKAIGFALSADGNMLAPTPKAAANSTELRDFIWNNGGWLCSTQPAVVYRVPLDNNKLSVLNQGTDRWRAAGNDSNRYFLQGKTGQNGEREKDTLAYAPSKEANDETRNGSELEDSKRTREPNPRSQAGDSPTPQLASAEPSAQPLSPRKALATEAPSQNQEKANQLEAKEEVRTREWNADKAGEILPSAKPTSINTASAGAAMPVPAATLTITPTAAPPPAPGALKGANTYAGTTAINGGTLNLNLGNTAGPAPFSAGAKLDPSGSAGLPGAPSAPIVSATPNSTAAFGTTAPPTNANTNKDGMTDASGARLGARLPVGAAGPPAALSSPANRKENEKITIENGKPAPADTPITTPQLASAAHAAAEIAATAVPPPEASTPVSEGSSPAHLERRAMETGKITEAVDAVASKTKSSTIHPAESASHSPAIPASPPAGAPFAVHGTGTGGTILRSDALVHAPAPGRPAKPGTAASAPAAALPAPISLSDAEVTAQDESPNDDALKHLGLVSKGGRPGEDNKSSVVESAPAVPSSPITLAFSDSPAAPMEPERPDRNLDHAFKNAPIDPERPTGGQAAQRKLQPQANLAKTLPDEDGRALLLREPSAARKNDGLGREQTEMQRAPASVLRQPSAMPAQQPAAQAAQQDYAPQAGMAQQEAPSYNFTNRNVEPMQVLNAPSQALSSLVPAAAEFRMITAMSDEGMVSRFVQDKLDLIFWLRPPEAPELVFGCLIEAGSLQELWPGLLGQTSGQSGSGQPPFILALLDDKAKPTAVQPASLATREWKRPFVASEIGEALPHWEAALYLATPGAMLESARNVRRTLSFTVAAALALILIGAWLVVADIRRQLALAQQKTDFVSNVSHELKTPLTSIRMFAELMHDRPPPVEKQGQYLRIITVEAERLTRLINNVLDFAKLERRQKRFEKHPIDFHSVIARTWEGLEMHLRDAGFTTRWQAAPGPYPVIGDDDALSQIFVNLLSNAEKYSPERKDVELHTWIEDGWIHLSVLDRGMGVPDGEERKIFESFYRAHDSLSSGIQGSGLGLTLAQRLAEEHGGKIEFARRDGGGCRFTLRLPLAPADPGAGLREPEIRGQSADFPGDSAPSVRIALATAP